VAHKALIRPSDLASSCSKARAKEARKPSKPSKPSEPSKPIKPSKPESQVGQGSWKAKWAKQARKPRRPRVALGFPRDAFIHKQVPWGCSGTSRGPGNLFKNKCVPGEPQGWPWGFPGTPLFINRFSGGAVVLLVAQGTCL
jgi:hypothetical protein